MCRDSGDNANLTYFDIRARCTYLRRKARNKRAPVELQKLYKRLLAAEKKERDLGVALKEFRKKHSEHFKEYRKLLSQRWQSRRRVDMAKRTLGLFNDSSYPIPIVVSRPKRRRHIS